LLSRGDVRPLATTEGAIFSAHAIDRMREHESDVDVPSAQAALASSEHVACELAAALLQRSLEAVRDAYRITADRRGILVLATALSRGRPATVVVTYLRLGPMQRDLARSLWGA
jgi:hypothetical protein